MKKILIIVGVIIVFFAFMKAKEWYNNLQNEKYELIQKNLGLQQTVQEDSLTIATQATTIYSDKSLINLQSVNIEDLREKYNSEVESHVRLEAIIDSIKADVDTIYVQPDSLDSTVVGFNETLGDGWFEVYGKVHIVDPIYVFGLGMHQVFPIIIEVTMERLPGNENYASFTYVNYPELEIASTPVKVLDRRRWIDKLSFTAHLSTIKFGVGAGLMYENYGVAYMQFTDGPALMFNYSKNIGEFF